MGENVQGGVQGGVHRGWSPVQGGVHRGWSPVQGVYRGVPRGVGFLLKKITIEFEAESQH